MGIWCDIQSHPTRPRPLPHPKPRPHIFNMFAPAKRTNRVADLQEQLFSLFSSKYHCPQQVSRSEDDRPLREFPRNGENRLQKYTRAQTIFVFLLCIIALSILRPTIHNSMCYNSLVSVALTCPLFLQIGNILPKSRHAWQR